MKQSDYCRHYRTSACKASKAWYTISQSLFISSNM